jgi:hypothetical protein
MEGKEVGKGCAGVEEVVWECRQGILLREGSEGDGRGRRRVRVRVRSVLGGEKELSRAGGRA